MALHFRAISKTEFLIKAADAFLTEDRHKTHNTSINTDHSLCWRLPGQW